MTATTRADLADARAFATVGRAVVETDIGLFGERGERLAHDGATVGELGFRSPALMDGYWGRDDPFVEGWFRSGDLGTIDPDGRVTIADRRTDLIVSGGMNVYPSEVEECIAELPGVRECAVVGVPHERWGQAVVAVVVGAIEPGAVIAHCRGRLASYKKPTEVLIAPELPRTASQKVRRGTVREAVLAGRLSNKRP
jgi:acyl-CoA synthetase (AMP-forming)/AMP-acid ligase II